MGENLVLFTVSLRLSEGGNLNIFAPGGVFIKKAEQIVYFSKGALVKSAIFKAFRINQPREGGFYDLQHTCGGPLVFCPRPSPRFWSRNAPDIQRIILYLLFQHDLVMGESDPLK